jgi:hypothetical protein
MRAHIRIWGLIRLVLRRLIDFKRLKSSEAFGGETYDLLAQCDSEELARPRVIPNQGNPLTCLRRWQLQPLHYVVLVLTTILGAALLVWHRTRSTAVSDALLERPWTRFER